MRSQPRYRSGDKIAGRYQVHQALMGGMGEVYLCLDLETIQPYALKTFQQRYLTNLKVRELFKEEVATWVALEKHPNIVRCFFMKIIDNQPFMFLEWIAGDESRGTDLRSWLRHGPLDLRLALDFTIDICRGLIHAGQKQLGIVHRDLKPENILIAQGRLAKITDWGLAKIVQEAELEISDGDSEPGERQSLTGAGGIVGTPAYMAPEQWLGEELDARTDIYAVGCVLYEMLEGHRPFLATTLEDLRRQHLESDVPKVSNVRALPSSLNMLLARSTAKRRAERIDSVGNLLRQLELVYQQQYVDPPRALLSSEEFTARDYTRRGVTYEKLDRHEDALADHHRAIELNPTDAIAYYNRGVAYRNLQRYDEALADFNRAIDLDSSDTDAYINRGGCYGNLQRYEEALADFNQAVRLDPTSARAYSNRGSTFVELQRYEEALTDFNRAVQLDPTYAQAYSNRGRTYANLQRYEEALADFDRAIRLDPTLALAHYNRGVTYVDLQRYEDALIDVSRAIQLGPAFAVTYIRRGEIYTYLQRHEEALADFNRAVQLDPTDVTAYYNRAITYRELQQYDKALTDFSRAIQLEPGFVLAYVVRGDIYMELQRYDEALADYGRAIQVDPNYAEAYTRRGIAYTAVQRHDEALANLNQAIRLDPTNATAYLNVGAWLANSGRFNEALPHLEKAAELGSAQGTEYLAQLKQMLSKESVPQAGPAQLALAAFEDADSLDEMQLATADFPFMTGTSFIVALEQAAALQVLPEHRPAFNQRLAWLRQIAEEQDQ